ncbi:MAG: hypothetical protein AVDCRST_MAG93-457, partial [uncultured Chloroflexia bacterium]
WLCGVIHRAAVGWSRRMAKRYELTDRQWAVLRDLVPGKAEDRGRTAA